MAITEVIKYEGDNSTFIWKYPSEDFNCLTQLIVHENGKRVHTISVAGLLETDYRIPNLDYSQLLKLTRIVTKDIQEVYKMYRLMCFNAFSHNYDDHSKNFSYIYIDNKYVLSPAYDLTYSNSLNSKHATTINNKGNPSKEDLIEVGLQAGLKKEIINRIADEIYLEVNLELKKYFNRF